MNAIRVALEDYLNDTPATPAPALPAIAWPNVPFHRVTGTSFIRAELVPIQRRPVVIGPTPQHMVSGLFYLTIYTPEDKGADTGTALADKLLSRFDSSTVVTAAAVSIYLAYSEMRKPLHDPPFYVIPIEIGWYAHA